MELKNQMLHPHGIERAGREEETGWERLKPEDLGTNKLPVNVWSRMPSKNSVSEKDAKSDLLMTHYADGSQEYLFAKTFKSPDRCYGRILDVVNKGVVGQTTFFGVYDASAEPKNRYIYVVSTGTDYTDFEHRGLGERRILAINEYCLEHYGLPLSSGLSRSDSFNRLWKKMIKEGLAKETTLPDGKKMYVCK